MLIFGQRAFASQILLEDLNQTVQCIADRVEIEIRSSHWLVLLELNQHHCVLG